MLFPFISYSKFGAKIFETFPFGGVTNPPLVTSNHYMTHWPLLPFEVFWVACRIHWRSTTTFTGTVLWEHQAFSALTWELSSWEAWNELCQWLIFYINLIPILGYIHNFGTWYLIFTWNVLVAGSSKPSGDVTSQLLYVGSFGSEKTWSLGWLRLKVCGFFCWDWHTIQDVILGAIFELLLIVFVGWMLFVEYVHLGVSKNRGTPKWMVYNGKPY